MEKQLSAHYVLKGMVGYVTGSGEGCGNYAFDYSEHLDHARVFNTVRQALDFVEQTGMRNARRSNNLNTAPYSGGLWLVQIALESPPPPPLRRRIVKEYR